ncbi:SAF domain-containing protein [Bogoriella caseilytica]|uniref:Flp pilus assembly protein CpaB n=1 Tax=Bogoriella caseilytica TaxID=56055 RepID=A0A3N2BDR9_9MICO|nr:SAF domain-containing protein [Bogoriella caseilytica]ROR73400.1 Flp pilus assembly protein CpaB [Bogoriella caseilytica]
MVLTEHSADAATHGGTASEAPSPSRSTPAPSRRRRARLRRFGWRYRFVLAGLLVLTAVATVVPGILHTDPDGVPALVLTADTAAGSEIRPADVEVRSLPAGAAPASALTDVAQVEGGTLALGLPAGTTLLPSMLVGPGLADHAPAGHVVVAVPLSDIASVRLAEPGRSVDLLAGPEHGNGPAVLAARSAVVLAHAEEGITGGGGLLAPAGAESGIRHIYVAVPPDTATVLLGASTWSPLHAVLPGQ